MVMVKSIQVIQNIGEKFKKFFILLKNAFIYVNIFFY